MRTILVVAMLALAGCAAEDHSGHEGERWTYTQRSTAEDVVNLSASEGFNASLDLYAAANARQLGGQWHGALANGRPITLSFRASVDMIVEWRVKAEEVGGSGRCEWGPEGATKEMALGPARMTNTTRTCEIEFTPGADLFDPREPTLRWEARSARAEPAGWSLNFTAAQP